ncbi:MAG: transposase [Actinomycetota bacterium]|nr:transposase [Actinomycetota bacterium]
MPDVSSTAPADVDQWIVFDVHKNSLGAGMLPAAGGTPPVARVENTERAIRRFIERLGDPHRLAVAYEAGPCGYELFRLLEGMGVACDVIAPSLVPVRAGDRVKTDFRDAKKLVRLYRAGELSFVEPPSPAQEGLRDLVRARDDLRRARTAARHQVAKQLLRHGHVYREGKTAWTKRHEAWLWRQRLADPLAQRALCHMRAHLEALGAQLAAIEHELCQVATSEPWCDPVRWLLQLSRHRPADRARPAGRDRRLSALLAPARADELSRPDPERVLLGRTAAPRAHHQVRQPPRALAVDRGRLALPARPAPIGRARALAPAVPTSVTTRAWQAQVRLHHRHRTLTANGKRSTVANVAVARELTGFIWAAMTHQPLREEGLAA